MAEDKKAFVVYTDWETQFDLLSDEEAGKLIKHIFSYVNDKDPEFDKNERLLNMAFEPIKKQLKRDLKKYETIKQKRSEAGKRSAELRAQQSQQVSTSVDFVQQNSTNVNTVQHRSTNPTVTVKVIDTDIVTDIGKDTVTVTEREINNIGGSHTQNLNHFIKRPVEDLKKNCANYSEWLNVISKKNSLTPAATLEWLEAFELHMLGKGTLEETESEFKRYFNSWITSEIRQGRKPKVEAPPDQKIKVDATSAFQNSLIKKYGHVGNS